MAKQTDDFGTELDYATQDLLAVVQNQLKPKFANDRNNFEKIADTIAAVANDTQSISNNNLPERLTQVKGNIDSLTEAFGVANQGFDVISKGIKALAS